MDLGEVRRYLKRTEWFDFPDVLICAPDLEVHRHPHYPAAKIGDAKSADSLIQDILTAERLDLIRGFIGDARPKLLAVHAVESAGMNAIPRVLASRIAGEFDLALESGVAQINRVSHTKAKGFHRLAYPAVFDGRLSKTAYLLVDDFVGQGGTLANIRGHVHEQGAWTVGALALAGREYSSRLRPEETMLQELRGKHGDQLEKWWISAFGYGFDRLTQSEARYLCRSDSFDAIATGLAAARRTGN